MKELMTAQRLEKLQGHTKALVHAFLGLRLNYGLLKPLLGNPLEPLDQPPAGVLRNGLSALSSTLFLSCVLDVVKLAWDTDRRTPSIANLLQALDDPRVVNLIVAEQVDASLSPRVLGDQPGNFERSEAERRRVYIDDLLGQLRAKWLDFDGVSFKDAFLTMRDRHIAHLEVRYVGGTYEPVNLGRLGVNQSDLGIAISGMESMVRDLNAVVRDADFQMNSAVRIFDREGSRLWERLQS
jgi:hypothetical protein